MIKDWIAFEGSKIFSVVVLNDQRFVWSLEVIDELFGFRTSFDFKRNNIISALITVSLINFNVEWIN